MVDERALLDALQVFATRSVQDYDVSKVLDEVGARARSALRLDGAGITLKVRQGKKETRHLEATDESTLHVERVQDRFAEGPCVDAIGSGEPTTAADVSAFAQRWPRYAPVVLDAGYRRVAAIPMLADERVIGALDAYRAAPGAWTPQEIEAAALFARVATTYIANACAYVDQATLAAQLQHALDSRVIIEQAKGVLAERHGLPMEQAFEVMRQYARSERIKLEDVAADVLSGRAAFKV